jgi:hypothetical protein
MISYHARDKENYFLNYFNIINFIFCSYKQFDGFIKNNKKKFKQCYEINEKQLLFPIKLLIIIITKHFLNKLYLIFVFKKRKKFYADLKKNESKNEINAEWFLQHSFYWNNIFTKFSLYKKPLQILEIGSFEGYSSLYFLKNFPNSIITCVDTWENHKEYKNFDLSKVEMNFDLNTNKYKNNLKKFKKTSDLFFKKNCSNKKCYYDIIYIDGDHFYETVFRDLINSFKVLKKGGLLIIDDFLGYNFYKDINENPISAIIVFINIFYNNIKILKITNQIIIKKI